MPRSPDLRQEREWITGLRAGRLDAYRGVFDAYVRRLLRFAQVWVVADVADSIVQDVLFDLWRRANVVEIPTGTLAVYLFSAVRDRVVPYLREQSATRERAPDETMLSETALSGVSLSEAEAGEAVTDEVASSQLDDDLTRSIPTISAITASANGELRLAVDRVMVRLPEAQRAVLLLRWTQDMSYDEIAAVLSISTHAAALHASRARRALYPALHELFDLDASA